MLVLNHLLPDSHPSVAPPAHPTKMKELMPVLHTTMAIRWTPIPESGFETFLQIKDYVPCLAFRKEGKEVYFHIFCFESFKFKETLKMVSKLYLKYRLGIPKYPPGPNWIHTVPIPGPRVAAQDEKLMYQIMQSFFWTLHYEFKMNVQGKKN